MVVGLKVVEYQVVASREVEAAVMVGAVTVVAAEEMERLAAEEEMGVDKVAGVAMGPVMAGLKAAAEVEEVEQSTHRNRGNHRNSRT